MGPSPSSPPPSVPPSSRASRASVSPSPRDKKRPWYLMTGLVLAWVLGAGCLVDACHNIAFYKADMLDEQAVAEQVATETQREDLAEPVQKFFRSMDDARTRFFPLSVAVLILGSAMVALSARVMGGRGSSRGALVQVAGALAIVALLTYALTGEVRHAQTLLYTRAGGVWRYWPRLKNPLEATVAVFIVLALTRRRSRAFFEPVHGSLPDR